MSEFHSDVLVTDRRRPPKLRQAQARNVAVAPAPSVASQSGSTAASTEITIAERRQIIDRRRQERRRQIDPTTCERDYSENEVEFMRAMDDYKRKSGRPFPTWSEVLEVLVSLGYRKVAEPSTLEWRTFGENTGSL